MSVVNIMPRHFKQVNWATPVQIISKGSGGLLKVSYFCRIDVTNGSCLLSKKNSGEMRNAIVAGGGGHVAIQSEK